MTGQESTVISITKDEATESPNAGTGQFRCTGGLVTKNRKKSRGWFGRKYFIHAEEEWIPKQSASLNWETKDIILKAETDNDHLFLTRFFLILLEKESIFVPLIRIQTSIGL